MTYGNTTSDGKGNCQTAFEMDLVSRNTRCNSLSIFVEFGDKFYKQFSVFV